MSGLTVAAAVADDVARLLAQARTAATGAVVDAGHRLNPNTAGLRMMRAVRVDVMSVCIGTLTVTQPD